MGKVGKKREIAVANLKAQCEKNSNVKVMIIPFKNEYLLTRNSWS